MMNADEISAGATICTVSDAKFTDALTPGISLRVRSTVFTQEEQVIPETEYV
jgi:3-hydroxymyristoyl/3-hydroxydecanoyl-(acyl carrier protein) dehydratase